MGHRSYGHAPPAFVARPALPRLLALARLARESWLDGCHNEGLAALLAGAEARVAGDAEEARVSALIAGEEAGHAALAYDILRWVLTQSPQLVDTLPALPSPRSAPSIDSSLSSTALTALAHQNTRLCQSQLASLRS